MFGMHHTVLRSAPTVPLADWIQLSWPRSPGSRSIMFSFRTAVPQQLL